VPLIERVGRIHKVSLGEPPMRRDPDERRWQAHIMSNSAEARVYIAFLALRGSLRLDWEWLLGMRVLGSGIMSLLNLDTASAQL
jgi:hypothetical protein